jgi:hypothetical protein
VTHPVAAVFGLLATCWFALEWARGRSVVAAAVEVGLTLALFAATYLIVAGGQT